MGKSGYVRCSINDDVVTITLDKPKHNVMNLAMMNDINGELESVLGDDSPKCLVFEAEGSSWCAGVEVSDHKPEVVSDMISVFTKMFKLIHKLEIPTIAAVHGACLGGGMELAIACDIILASESAVFGQPEIKLGFFPPYAAVRLPTLVGAARSIEICTTGRRYSSSEALQMGMISEVIPGTNKNTLSSRLDKILKEIRDCSPLIIRLNKKAVINSLGVKFDYSLLQTNDLFLNTLMKTEDVREGIASFEEKRKPSWLNK